MRDALFALAFLSQVQLVGALDVYANIWRLRRSCEWDAYAAVGVFVSLSLTIANIVESPGKWEIAKVCDRLMAVHRIGSAVHSVLFDWISNKQG